MMSTRIETLTDHIQASKYKVERMLRRREPYKSVPVADLINDAAGIIAEFVLRRMERVDEK